MKIERLAIAALLIAVCANGDEPKGDSGIRRNAFFGDLHVHTKNSADAYMFQVRATPDDAYVYARGGVINHPLGYSMQLRGLPLDFMAVTDHGELIGVLPAMDNPESPVADLPWAEGIRSDNRKDRKGAFFALIKDTLTRRNKSKARNLTVIRSAWQETIEAAERHNRPGVFTTFVGYEYSSAPENQNLHRNVIFRSSDVPELPFSAVDSDNPEDLWRWMDGLRIRGIDALAIPHNANVSNGLMFDDVTWDGSPIDADYADARRRNEPLVEVTQVKGTSETHPLLSPNDEWAGFELYDTLIASPTVSKKPGGFVRDAYRRGLRYRQETGSDPYHFGLVGSSDSHNGGGSIEENRFYGKSGVFDGSAERRGSVPNPVEGTFGTADAVTTFRQWGAAGLAGIWAEQNTRDSLFAGMQRRETFATSGTRIQVRFFAGFDYVENILDDTEAIVRAYELGVPMGSELTGNKQKKPSFFVWASRDPNSAPLQRLQIVKGWFDGRLSHEQVFDVACSGGGIPDATTFRCPDNGARVDLADCTASVDKGAAELKVLWSDPTFNPGERAFYYVRVLENPTCRWSTWDALRAGTAPLTGLQATIQERAWSSPIWYLP